MPIYIDDNESFISEWSRDFVPLSLRRDDMLYFFSNSQFKSTHPLQNNFSLYNKIESNLSNYFKIPIFAQNQYKNIDSIFENGDFMVDHEGRCYIGELSKKNENIFKRYCREIIYLPEIDMESTTHIDLFSKIIAPNKVVITKYSSNKVALEKAYSKTTRVCSDTQIKEKKWGKMQTSSLFFSRFI